MSKLQLVDGTTKKSAILGSFHKEKNDLVRMRTRRLSLQYYQWFCVTLDGETWEAYAHIPENYVQCVQFWEGKVIKVLTTY